MSGKKNVVSIVWELAEPVALSLGLKLWDVRFLKEGANWYLRIIIDKDEGVSIDDCVNMNNALEPLLDEKDPIEQSYNLQVSSPGIERNLTRDAHFKEYLNEKIMVKLPKAIDGAKEFHGVLKEYEDGEITLEYGDGKILKVNKKETSFVKADDFNGFD